MLPLQITVAFISPPKKITTKKHQSQWICSPYIKQTNRRLLLLKCRGTQIGFNPAWHSNLRGARTSGFLGRPTIQHRMGRRCFRKGNVFNHPQKNIHPLPKLTTRNLKSGMVFPNIRNLRIQRGPFSRSSVRLSEGDN